MDLKTLFSKPMRDSTTNHGASSVSYPRPFLGAGPTTGGNSATRFIAYQGGPSVQFDTEQAQVQGRGFTASVKKR